MGKKSPKNTRRNNSARKSPKSPRNQRKKPIRNIYMMLQFKKQIGKGLITLWKGITTNPDREHINKIKTQIILEPDKKTITITCVCIRGILYVITGVEKYMAIMNISYDEIKKRNLKDVPIVVVQYSNLTQSEIKKLI